MYYGHSDFVNSPLKSILCSILKSKPLFKVLKWLGRATAKFSAHVVRYDSAPGWGVVLGDRSELYRLVIIADYPAISPHLTVWRKFKGWKSGLTLIESCSIAPAQSHESTGAWMCVCVREREKNHCHLKRVHGVLRDLCCVVGVNLFRNGREK